MRTSVWLVRHGQTRANLERRYLGRGDSQLTDYGRLQIKALQVRLRRIPFYVGLSSPSERTRITAAAILEDRPDVPQVADPAWYETDHGRWEGLTYAEVLQHFPEEARDRWAAGVYGHAVGGESLADVQQRVSQAWRTLLQTRRGGRILLVTHATPIQLLLCGAFGLSPEQYWHWRIDLGSITCFDVYDAGVIVRMVNEVPRISGKHDVYYTNDPCE
jgi:alpha-ribazole phosphatase